MEVVTVVLLLSPLVDPLQLLHPQAPFVVHGVQDKLVMLMVLGVNVEVAQLIPAVH